MKKPFTDEDILRFLYDEMSQEESEALLAALVHDEDLWQRYETLQESIEQVSGLSVDPSEDSISAIRAYVRNSAATEHPSSQSLLSQSVVSKGYLKLGRISINLNALVGAALGTFILITVAGSAYDRFTREKFQDPNTTNYVKSEEKVTFPDAPDSQFEWDMGDIEEDLKEVEEGIKVLQNNS